MESGKLRHRLTIQVGTETASAIGKGTSITWADVSTVYGSIRPLTAREIDNGKAQQADITHEIRIRHYAGLTSKHRFKFGTRVFNIEAPPRNLYEIGREMAIMCKEVE